MDVSHYLQRLQLEMPRATEAIARQDWDTLSGHLLAMATEIRLAQSSCRLLAEAKDKLEAEQTAAQTQRQIDAARKRYHEDLGKRMFGTDW